LTLNLIFSGRTMGLKDKEKGHIALIIIPSTEL